MINETYFSVMFHKTRLPEFPTTLLFLLLLPLFHSLRRVKKILQSDNDGKQDWFSVPVPPSAGTRLQVTGLSPNTDYQFSILSHNKMGTGPFSEITTTRTLGQYHSSVILLSVLTVTFTVSSSQHKSFCDQETHTLCFLDLNHHLATHLSCSLP